MQPIPDLSIIIVTYNAAQFLTLTLDSIRLQRGLSVQTIVVDNHSSDNTLDTVRKSYPWVEVVERKTNIGFSAGNNAGVSRARADLILFLNPDVIFQNSDDLKLYVEKYRTTPGVGLLTPRVNLKINNELDQTCHRGFPTPWAAFTHFSGLEKLFPRSAIFSQYTQGYKDINTEHEVDAVGGMCVMISRKIGTAVGWWDETYPFYGEDLDLSYRVREAGYKNIFWPDVIVLHYKGATTGMSKQSRHVTSASRETTRQVKGWSVDAMEIFYRKHYMNKYPAYLTWLVFTGISLMRLWRTRLSA
jgi:GT2 family glycosyltransferase